jgi:phosphatidate cytidylyltransferase
MLNRIITGIMLIASFYVALFHLPLIYISSIFSIISLYGFYEWLKISRESSLSIIFNLGMMIILMLLLIFFHSHSTVMLLTYVSLFFWIIIPIDMLYGSKLYKKLLKSNSSLVGLYMIISAWFLLISLGSTSETSVIEDNKYLLFSITDSNMHMYLFFLIALISTTDASGYFIGRFFGEAKLCKDISPNKTLIGLFGSLFIPIILFSLIFNYAFSIPILIEDLFFMLLCCIYCTYGDLFVSIFKRYFNVKDTGDILPGHGGVLDRLDSYLPTISIFQIWFFL